VDYTSGTASWRLVVRRAAAVLAPRRLAQRQRGWSVAVPLIALAAGLLFTTTATTARGTALRDDRRPELTQLIADERDRIAAQQRRVSALQAAVDAQNQALTQADKPVKQLDRRVDAERQPAGFTALHGPGLTVRLNDSPRRPGKGGPGAPSNDDLVVHQGDVQAVVNAMWAGGAEAMSIMGLRVISTSAVRCVGNTLLLDGRVYSPPFTVTAIGDPGLLQHALDASDGVRAFREAATDFGLGYEVKVEGDVTLPAYDGSVALNSARAQS
jgi:uncharacterized protein YlxW (UPF0749 family)